MVEQIFKSQALILSAVACFAFSLTAQAESPARVYRGYSTAVGDLALHSLTSGVWNTAIGGYALSSDTTGDCNTAIGTNALRFNTAGRSNAAYGVNALQNSIAGSGNTGLGDGADIYLAKGNKNIFVGNGAGINITAGDESICIGNPGVAGESETIRLGSHQTRTFITGIRGVTTASGDAIPVVIDSAGQLGTTSSSKRFKKGIKPMDKASEAILQLKPVTFAYKNDSKDTPQFGLIGEDVAKVNPALVVRDDKGGVYTVRYDAVNAMLLNEFLKEHRKIEQQQATIGELRSTIAQQQKGMEALATQLKQQNAKIEKVSAQIEGDRPTPQLAKNR
jgi:uncharacterized coiled-coil protein SlyX